MRVYEIAREYNISSKDLLALLVKGGFSSYTHMSVLQEDAHRYVLMQLTGKAVEVEDKKQDRSPAVGSMQNKESTKKAAASAKTSQEKVSIKNKQEQTSVEKKDAVTPAGDKGIALSSKKRPSIQKLSSLSNTSKNMQIDTVQSTEQGVSKHVVIERELPLFEVATLLGKSSGDLILALMKRGVVCNRNHVLSVEQIELLAKQFGVLCTRATEQQGAGNFSPSQKTGKDGVDRFPVVVVMGHVDHGKTTLLDFIRKTRVASREHGGITQSIGAYEVDSSHGRVIFLDTPGHETFSHMRVRGTRVTDIAVLVVAADDGVKPQTVEAIEYAQKQEVPIVVAINKVDKADQTAIDTIKRQLTEHGVVPEDWGGDVVCVPISALTGQGVDELLEMIVLQAQMLDLKMFPDAPAAAFVLESHIEKGHGPVATAVVSNGTLRQGDYFLCGSTQGKVRLMYNSLGRSVVSATAPTPVKIIGFDHLVSSGKQLEVVPYEHFLKRRSRSGRRCDTMPTLQETTSTQVGTATQEKTLRFIVKADTFGSVEAVVRGIEKIAKMKSNADVCVQLVVAHSGVGDISEKDVVLAQDSDAILLGFNVKAERNAAHVAKESCIALRSETVIYRLLEFIEELAAQAMVVEPRPVKVGEGVVLKVFNIPGKGVITGMRVTDGSFLRNGKVVCRRDGEVVGESSVSSLERNNVSITEATVGMEIAFFGKDFQGWDVGDTVECVVVRS